MRGNVVGGVGYLFEGAKLLTHPSLRLFVIVPLLVNIIVFGTLVGAGLSYLSGLIDTWLSWIPDWLGFIEWVLWPLLWLAVSLIMGYHVHRRRLDHSLPL